MGGPQTPFLSLSTLPEPGSNEPVGAHSSPVAVIPVAGDLPESSLSFLPPTQGPSSRPRLTGPHTCSSGVGCCDSRLLYSAGIFQSQVSEAQLWLAFAGGVPPSGMA